MKWKWAPGTDSSLPAPAGQDGPLGAGQIIRLETTEDDSCTSAVGHETGRQGVQPCSSALLLQLSPAPLPGSVCPWGPGQSPTAWDTHTGYEGPQSEKHY